MQSSDHSLRPVPSQRRYLHVAQQILQGITRGEPAAGARLPTDRELAQQANVSRATTREALLVLELLGVIEVRHGEGAFVTETSIPLGRKFRSPLDVAPSELVETRAEIEPIIASLAAARIDKRRLTKLQRNLEQTAALVDDHDSLPEFVRLGLRFHTELAPCCGNRVLAGIASQLADIEEHPLWTLVNQLAMRTRDAREDQVREHTEILDAIIRRDPPAAAASMSRHLSALMTEILGTALAPTRIVN